MGQREALDGAASSLDGLTSDVPATVAPIWEKRAALAEAVGKPPTPSWLLAQTASAARRSGTGDELGRRAGEA